MVVVNLVPIVLDCVSWFMRQPTKFTLKTEILIFIKIVLHKVSMHYLRLHCSFKSYVADKLALTEFLFNPTPK